MSIKSDIISKALFNTNPDKEFRFYDGDIDTLEWVDAAEDHTSIDVIKTEIDRLEAEYTANEYSRKRAAAYDSVGNQLDQLMKDMRDGTTTHQEACEAVKAKFPKPT
tara:strand:+ start:998 stop:1318 length:321 start_codon:yes stop_codon:yes gene_type:complete